MRTLGIMFCIVVLLFAIGGTYGTIHYYGRYRDTKASLDVYIEFSGRELGRISELKQIIERLAERDKRIAEEAKRALAALEGKHIP